MRTTVTGAADTNDPDARTTIGLRDGHSGPRWQLHFHRIELRVLVVVPGTERVIRYDMPTWQVDGTSLVHAAAWNQHVSLYPVPAEGDLVLDADLAPYAGAKGTLKLPYSKIDYDLIERVVRRLLQTR